MKKINFQDLPIELTPIDSDNLNLLQQNIENEFTNVHSNIAETYSDATTYSIGDIVIYNSLTYICTTTISTPEVWTIGHWSQTHLATEIVAVENRITTAETDIDKLKNVTKYITATATTNGDFKVNIQNVLATGMILNISFPAAISVTSNARLSIDNGTNYKNILNEAGTQLLGSNVQNTSLSLVYDGTSFKKCCYLKSLIVGNKTTTQNVTVGAGTFTKILLDSTEITQGNGFTFESNQIKVNKKMVVEVNACADLYQFSGNCALAIIKNNDVNNGRICFIWQLCYNTGDNSVLTPGIPIDVVAGDIISLYFYTTDAQTSKSVLHYNSTKLVVKEL